MSSVTLPRLFAAAAVISAAVLVFATRERKSSDLPADSLAAEELPTIEGPADAQTPTEDHGETAVAAKLHELTAMSETYRNTTFVIAIRDAGFVCHDLERVYGGVNSSTTWTAHCRDMLAYTVGIGSSGALFVEPMMPHLDSTPRPIQREGPRPRPPSPLER